MAGVHSAPPRRVEALAYIVERIHRSGTSPSYGEIAKALRPPVHRSRIPELIGQLVELGAIDRPPASRRGIQIRDWYLCRKLIDEGLGQTGWWHAAPLSSTIMPPSTFG